MLALIPTTKEAEALVVVIAFLRQCEAAREDSGGKRCIPTLTNYLKLWRKSCRKR